MNRMVVLLIVLVGVLVFVMQGLDKTREPDAHHHGSHEHMPEEEDTGLAWEGDEAYEKALAKLERADLKEGTGRGARAGDVLTVHYTGWLTDGTKFDSSFDRQETFGFVLGQGNVIRGWDEGLVGMKVGGKRKLTIPSELGYGSAGAGNVIPPDATLVFEIELVALQ